MRIQLIALAAATLWGLALPRVASAGIPLGDLVRTQPAPTAPPGIRTERAPTLAQLTPSMGGTGAATSTSIPVPSSTSAEPTSVNVAPSPNPSGTPSTSDTTTAIGTTSSLSGSPTPTQLPAAGLANGTSLSAPPGLNLQSPGLPPTTPSSSTVGGIPMTASPSTGTTNSGATVPPTSPTGIPGDHP